MRKIRFNPGNGWDVETGKLLFSFFDGHIVKVKSDLYDIDTKYWVKFTDYQYGTKTSGQWEELVLEHVFLYYNFQKFNEALLFIFKTKFNHWTGMIKSKVLSNLAKHNLIQLKNWR